MLPRREGREGRGLTARSSYCLRTGRGEERLTLWAFVRHRQVVRTAGSTALVVGTILTAINQGDLYLAHRLSITLLVKTVLTYMVPSCVATYGALSAARIREDR